MLLVKTTLDLSKISGIGLFAAEPIKKGTVVWEFTPLFDILLSKKVIESLAGPQKEQIYKYAYLDKKYGLYVLCGDDARFFNHSDQANCNDSCYEQPDVTIANKDIEIGEEITCNYKTFYGNMDEHKEIL